MNAETMSSLVPTHTAEERFAELMHNPTGSAHMFKLLADGKGDKEDFIRMLDRIIESRRAVA